MHPPNPDISAIVVTDAAALLERLLSALDAQTAKQRMELVVVAPASEHRRIQSMLPAGLANVKLIDRMPVGSLAPSKAEGVRAASSDIVVFTETHAFPFPNWAEALLDAHAQAECAAVGPALIAANPRPLSWANMLLDYGPFLAEAAGAPRPVADLPGHNSSYRREILLRHGERLESMLELETALHEDLHRRDERMLLAPRARLAHVNVTLARAWLRERWHGGCIYAGVRSREWSRGRRLLYSVAAPAIPLVRLRRALRTGRSAIGGVMLARAFPFMAVGVIVQSAGEACGYSLGRGSTEKLVEIELRRLNYLASDDPMRPHPALPRPPFVEAQAR